MERFGLHGHIHVCEVHVSDPLFGGHVINFLVKILDGANIE